jgi:hypothetical protein
VSAFWQQVQKGRHLQGMLVYCSRSTTLPLIPIGLQWCMTLSCSTVSTCQILALDEGNDNSHNMVLSQTLATREHATLPTPPVYKLPPPPNLQFTIRQVRTSINHCHTASSIQRYRSQNEWLLSTRRSQHLKYRQWQYEPNNEVISTSPTEKSQELQK